MRSKVLVGIVFLVGSAAACSSPVTPNGAATVTAASPASPASGAQFANTAQPVTLTVNNAFAAGGFTPTYTFEVATDPAFTAKVVTADVAQTTGQTSLKLGILAAGKDYYWRVRTSSGDGSGVFSSPLRFTIGAAVTLQAPVAVQPLSGATVADQRPLLIVTNAARSGAVGPLTYRFEIADDVAFSHLVVSETKAEGSGQTSLSPSGDLTVGRTFFWRATAIDQTNALTSPPSATQTFSVAQPTKQAQLAAQEGLTLWPGVQPTGTNGRAKLGVGWDVQTLVAGPGGPGSGTVFLSPPIDELQAFDLIDRGFDPGDAIVWLQTHGYSTRGVWFPEVAVIGFPFQYMALIGGEWELVTRVGG